MKEISCHPVLMVGERGVPLSSSIIHGIYIAFPPEDLHTFGVGLCAWIINVIHGSSITEDIELIDRLHASIFRDFKSNCDSDVPQSSLIKGATESVEQGAVENIGNLMTRNPYTHDDKDVVTPLITLFAYIGWLHSTNPKVGVDNDMPAVYDLLRDIKTFFSRDTGNGWDIPKFHGAIQLTECIQYHGSARNQYRGPAARRVAQTMAEGCFILDSTTAKVFLTRSWYKNRRECNPRSCDGNTWEPNLRWSGNATSILHQSTT